MMLYKVIDAILFVYVLSIYIFTYRVGFSIITNIIAGCFVYLVIINILATKRKIQLDRVIVLTFVFVTACTLSYFAALDKSITLTKIKTLLLNLVFLFALTNYVNDYNKILKLLKYYIFSGTIASIYILLGSDFSNLDRLGGVLGNENEMAIIIGIALIFVIYFVFFEKKYKYIILGVLMIPTIILTGSRKGIMLIVLSIFIMLILMKTKKTGERLKYMIFGSIVLAGLIYIIFRVPAFYQVLGRRLDNLLGYITAKGTQEGSILERALMIKFGIEMFAHRPIMGYGLDNYRVLFGGFSGKAAYSHNNYIELLVGTGILGLIAFYSIYADALIKLYRKIRLNDRLAVILFSLNAAIIILGYALVHYDSKHFFILLAMGSALCKLDTKETRREVEYSS